MSESINNEDVVIVGIGASAGGITALKSFFAQVPPDSGIAYVVILHLSPDHDSQLAAVLQTVCSIPVSQVIEKTFLQPDHVYVISPNRHLTMSDGHIDVTVNLTFEDRRAPVDIFFRTLAQARGGNAICVILSGTGANGSMGLRRIKEFGGTAYVQDPNEAEFNEMPLNSIATELVDQVLPVNEIPAHILAYKRNAQTIKIASDARQRTEDEQKALREIFSSLRLKIGHDFSNYKQATLLRRIERRLSILNLYTLSSYHAYIKQHPDELVALLKDLLISVTNFFRDPAAFEYLRTTILPPIFRGKTSDDQVRIWVAGCATGEEAYSLAILCAEYSLGMPDAPKIQIFATDIDESAISHAREGLYTLNDAADIEPERLTRYFTKEGNEYRVRTEIREMILFASHNFIKDPPFSRLDMVSCRNVLIYLNRAAQERVMEIFHFALNPAGYLFLGSSESADVAADLFMPLNRAQHIFQSRQISIRRYPVPESIPNLRTLPALTPASQDITSSAIERMTYGDLHQRLLEEYAPPSLVVNEEYDIVHLSERAGRYLQVVGGNVTQNLLKLIRSDLRLEVRSALFQAVQKKLPAEARGLQVHVDNEIETINLYVRPVLRDSDIAKGFFLVIFEKQAAIPGSEPVIRITEEPVSKHLEAELNRVKTQLKSAVEQHEFHAEELKATNEELQAMNEELRSAAEELETSKEELQSINEELRTVNQELKVKIDETTLSSNNLQNLVNSASIATIFLDRSFRIALFTPAACDIFNLITSDYGRPLSDITHRLKAENILEEATNVLQNLQPVEKEVTTVDDRVFIMRILPYRTAEDHITGLVLTFIDITSRIDAEHALHNSEERMRLATEAAQLYTWELELSEIKNPETPFALVLSILPPAALKDWNTVYPQEKLRLKKELEKDIRDDGPFEKEFSISIPDQELSWYHVVGLIINNDDGKPVRILGITRNITSRKDMENQLRESEMNSKAMSDLVPQLSWGMDGDGKYVLFNQRWTEFSGRDVEAFSGGWGTIVHPDDAAEAQQKWQEAFKTGNVFEAEFRLRRHDGEYRWHIGRAIPLKGNDGAVKKWFGSATDIEDLKQSQEYLRSTKERLRVTLESATDFAIITSDTKGNIEGWSSGAELIFGYSEDEIIGKNGAILFVPEDVANNVPEKEIKTAIATGRAIDERWHLHKDGHRFYASGVMTPIYDDVVIGLVKIARDVTTRKQTEEALLLSEERYRIVLQSADMGAWDWNAATNDIVWNEQHYLLFGLSERNEKITTDTFFRFVHPDDIASVQSKMKIAVEETGLYEAEFRIIRQDNGMVRWMNGYGRSVASVNGRATRLVGVMFDITDRKLMERQKDEFIGIASHELKTPVTGIKAYVEMLKLTFGENDPGKTKLIDKLEHQVDRLIALIKDLLDITKISEGQLNLKFQDFDINDLILESIDELRNLSPKHNITFNGNGASIVSADHERIGQVITNLISNAIKYSPNGGDVVINVEPGTDQIAISVRDSGIGIPDNARDRVFDRFFRVNNAQINSYPGMGLGLYITAEIVYRHGGNIWVESSEGAGSTFWFTLPYKQPVSTK